MTQDPTQPFTIDPNGIYDDAALVLALGLSTNAILGARRLGHLRFSRQGHRVLYLGQWIINWLEQSSQ